MSTSPFRPKDENGVPRRFRGHGEALAWAAGTLAKRYGPHLVWGPVYAGVAWLAWFVVRLLFPGFMPGLFPPGLVTAAAVVLAILFAIWVLVSVVVYLYIALAGGVMRRGERERPY